MQPDQLRRREFMSLLGDSAAAWPSAARAEVSRRRVVGVLSPLSSTAAAGHVEALHAGLGDLGYVADRNITAC
jgi:hypothetical protein